MHKTLYSILLNYFIIFQLVLHKEPSVLNVLIFSWNTSEVVHLIKLIVLENVNLFSLFQKIIDSEFYAN